MIVIFGVGQAIHIFPKSNDFFLLYLCYCRFFDLDLANNQSNKQNTEKAAFGLHMATELIRPQSGGLWPVRAPGAVVFC